MTLIVLYKYDKVVAVFSVKPSSLTKLPNLSVTALCLSPVSPVEGRIIMYIMSFGDRIATFPNTQRRNEIHLTVQALHLTNIPRGSPIHLLV